MDSKQFVQALYQNGITNIKSYVTIGWITKADYEEIAGSLYEEAS